MDATASLLILPFPALASTRDPGRAEPVPSADPTRAMDPPTDQELMERTVGGDADSFAILYRRYERPLFNFLLRVTGRRPLAEDLLQETFTRVWLAARTWDPGRGAARAWLYKVALNTARSELSRKRHRVPHLPLEDGAGATLASGGGEESVAARLDEADRARAVAQALAALPDYMKEVVILRCRHQLSFSEIAEITGAPEGTLKSRFHRAVAALRDSLGGKEGGP